MSRFLLLRSVLLRSCLAACVLFIPAAFATDAVDVGDTYIDSAAPASNFGTATLLQVGNGKSALIQFDIAGALPPGTTAAQIAKANLILFVGQAPALDIVEEPEPQKTRAVIK